MIQSNSDSEKRDTVSSSVTLSPSKQHDPFNSSTEQSTHLTVPLVPDTTTSHLPTPQNHVSIPFPTLVFPCTLSLEAEIDHYIQHHDFFVTKADFDRFELIRMTLSAIIKECLPNALDVELFGSARSTIILPHSDVDFFVKLDDSPANQLEMLKIAKDALKSNPLFSVVSANCGKRVTLIKGTTTVGVPLQIDPDSTPSDHEISFDLVFGHQLGAFNGDLISTYCECDERVRPFLLLVKYFAKVYKINDANKAKLSSYGWNILCLCYLQLVSPPIIPNLQSETYIAASDPSLVVNKTFEDGYVHFSCDCGPWTSRQSGLLPNPSDIEQQSSPRPLNTQSIGSLFVGLMDFVKNHFSPAVSLSLSHGTLLSTDSVKHLLKPVSKLPPFIILDPFEFLRNVAASVKSPGTLTEACGAVLKEMGKKEPSFERILSPKKS
ncbi:hypothetical protein BLNAU_14826 [Blattamonas nauphoetae]|uniref:Poly(A) RNA polymerase mitochondrial-like central palm domain-containing protein n=1 Tax=Blattamonas nauphoetae TaxID=2049346 RepID=A0ABQ9XCJ8_9EUKA|nr:hypothetical protein BLNAU_14826 [Blattamonas nauphoetae]